MENKFDIIFSDKKDFESYYNENNSALHRLRDLSNINILVGANNSGKSRFIRNVLKTSNIIWQERRSLIQAINSFNFYIRQNKFGGFNYNRNVKFLSYENSKQQILFEEILYSEEYSEILNKVNHNLKILNFLTKEKSGLALLYYGDDFKPLREIDEKNISIILTKISSKANQNFLEGYSKIFLPVLRTAHSLFESNDDEKYSKISKDIFKQTISHTHKLKSDETFEIFTGLDLYYQIVNIRNDVKDKRESFEKFEQFLSENFFQGKRIEIVAKFNIYNKHNGKDDSEIINVYIDDESKDLHDLGDGIQAIFILMYKIYTCENESVIFIDEPEINLHPGMQRLFLEQITTNEFLKEKKLTYFISTHSNHFLDLTIEKEDISIFLFNKVNKDKFVVKNVNHGDNSALQYLGVTNSSVFLANCSIWVE